MGALEDQRAAGGSSSGGPALTANEQRELEQYHSYDNFKRLHESQLRSIGLPPALWERLWAKLYADAYDVTSSFQVQLVEDEGYELAAKQSLQHHGDVWIIDHSWSTSCDADSKPVQQLMEVEGLLDRMWSLAAMELKLRQRAEPMGDDEIGNLSDEQRAQLTWHELFNSGLMQRYATTAALSNQRASALKAEDISFTYYCNDEIGSAVQQSQTRTNARLEPFIVLTQGGVGYTLLWLTQDVQAEQTIQIPKKATLPVPEDTLSTSSTIQHLSAQSALMSHSQQATPSPATTTEASPSIDEITVVMQTASVSREEAERALESAGNVTDAICELDSR